MTNRHDFIKQSSAIVAGGFFEGNIFSACQTDGVSQTVADEAFGNPPLSARPGVFWDWLNENITKAGITRDFEAMRSKGIMRAEIWDVAALQNTQMVPAGKPFLGDESVDALRSRRPLLPNQSSVHDQQYWRRRNIPRTAFGLARPGNNKRKYVQSK